MAVSAPQRDHDFQRELFQLKEVFEENLRTYEGQDPLEKWYDYILQVEECYFKTGNTNNLTPILEKCLQIFEADSRYTNDRRICKLWIKYIELQQQNPVELYQLLHSKNICVKCADLYCAWALYYELAGNFKQANNVFEMGMWQFAQPYEELVIAHKNMVFMAGLHAIHGVDERRLNERRQFLTLLHRNKVHQSSFYNTCQSSAQEHHPSLPFLSNPELQQRPSEQMLPPPQVNVPAPSCGGLMDVIRGRDNANSSANQETAASAAAIPRMEQPSNIPFGSNDGIRLYPDFSPLNHDDYSEWHVDMYYPEPELPDKIPMYPKHLVYTNNNMEFSLEEIKSRRYLAKKKQMQENAEQMKQDHHDLHMVTETEQAVQSIMSNDENIENAASQKSDMSHRNVISFTQPSIPEQQSFHQRQPYYPNASINQNYHEDSKFLGFTPQAKQAQHVMNEKGDAQSNQSHQNYSQPHQGFSQNNSKREMLPERNEMPKQDSLHNQIWQNTSTHEDSSTLLKDVNDFWKDTIVEPSVEVKKNAIQPFQIHEDTRLIKDESIRQEPPKSNIKTPFTDRQAEEASRKQFRHKENENRKAFAIARDSENYNASRNEQPQVYEDKNASEQNNFPSPRNLAFDTPEHAYRANMLRSPMGYRPFMSQPPQQSPNENYRQHLFMSPGNNAFATPDRAMPMQQQGSNRPPGRPFLSQPVPEQNENQRYLSQNEFAHPLDIKEPDNDIIVHGLKNPNPVILNDSCNTQMFNINFANIASTPFNQKKHMAQQYANELKKDEDEHLKPSKQKLFENPDDLSGEDKWYRSNQQSSQDKLSVIYEITKELSSSSGSSIGATTLKTTTFNAYSLEAIPENVRLKEHSRQANNSNHSKIYSQPNQNQSQYSHIENKNFSMSQHSLYNQNQMMPNSPGVVRHVRPEINDQSYRMNLLDETPKPATLQYSMVTVPNHSMSHTHLNYSSAMMREIQEQPSTLVEKPKFPSDQSYIYIDDNTEAVNNDSNLMRFSETHETNSQFQQQNQSQQQFNSSKMAKNQISDRERMQESPSKRESKEGSFYEGSNDSSSIKDIWGRSPAKGSRMDVDAMSQNSNSELKMDYDSCPEPPIKDDPILLKTPSDPFSSKLIKALLRKVGFPQPRHKKNYVTIQTLPRFKSKETTTMGDEKYLIGNIVGKGTYGSVFKASRLSNNDTVALKLQKPSNQWEFYICNEIQHRMCNPYLLTAFMSVQVGYFSPTGSILVSEFCKYGSLLDISNKMKNITGKGIKELVVIYFANEIVTIVNALHKCQIIHADIKPDNFLVTRLPADFGHPCLQLIDFGCSIDMTLFPKDTTFTKVINTENFTCTEMKDGRPWTYQTDLFCVAATVHVLLFEKYMQLQKRGTVWSIQNRVPRYMRTDLWNTFFFQFLNIESCNNLPDLVTIQKSLQTILSEQSEELQDDMRYLANCINGR